MTVMWDQQIKAVHEDGRVRPARHVQDSGYEHSIRWDDGNPYVWEFFDNGLPWPGLNGWRIRNVATPPAYAATAPNGGEVGQEVQRAAVMQLAEAAAALNVALDGRGWEAERRAIVDALKAVRDAGVLLPEPVDALEQVIADAMCGNNVQPFEVANAIRNSSAALRALEKEAGR